MIAEATADSQRVGSRDAAISIPRPRAGMTRVTRLVVVVALALLLAVGIAYGAFALLLSASDHATYYADGQNLGPVDYPATLDRAEAADYAVVAPRYVNARTPRGAAAPASAAVREAYGDDVRVWRVTYDHPGGATLELTYEPGGDAVGVIVTNRTIGADLEATPTLPPADWLADRFATATTLSPSEAEQAAEDFHATVADTEPSLPTTTLDAGPDVIGLRDTLAAVSDEMTLDPSRGEGTFSEHYHRADATVATVTYLVPNAAIRHRVDDVDYRVYVDQLGGVRLEVRLDPGERVSLETRERVFRSMFETLGLPVDAVERYEWSYSSGTW